MRVVSVALVLALCASALPAPAADPVDEVRRAEIAFAKAFADRDQAAFFGMVLEDASFLAPNRTLAGKKQVVERWSRFFAGPKAPFSWGPERVVVNAAGTVGLSTGPVFDPDGHHVGNFSSVWLKQPGGGWKVLFDGPGSPAACLAESEAKQEEGFVTADDGAKLHFRRIAGGPTTLVVPLEFVVFDDWKQLADVATVIAYDPRNRGRSEPIKDGTRLTIQDDVKDLEAVRKHFKLETFVPVGYSYLGLMVALYAMEHPERVARMVQVGPVPIKWDTEYPKHLTHGREDAGVPEADLAAFREMKEKGQSAKAPREFCEAQWKVLRYHLVGDAAHVSRLASSCALENEWPSNFDKHLDASFGSVQKLRVAKADLAAKLTMPVLTIHGTKDRNAPYGGGREWAMTLPNARLVTVEGAAHQAWADDPVIVFGSVREFLRGSFPLGSEKVTKLDPKAP
jgi:pimeloyl-ACP methyl ester carboxylesterase/ketosteroid isomerase-like protein